MGYMQKPGFCPIIYPKGKVAWVNGQHFRFGPALLTLPDWRSKRSTWHFLNWLKLMINSDLSLHLAWRGARLLLPHV
jgi:hypothetical protein